MNKSVIFGVFTFMAGAVPVANAAECQPAEKYTINALSFPKTEAENAMHKLLGGTPLLVKLQDGAKGLKVGAEKISGDLRSALDALSKEAELTWSQNGCTIELKERQRPVQQASFAVVAGESLEKTLRRWVVTEGWEVAWDIEEVEALQLGANASFSGPLEAAVTSLNKTLAKSGEKLHIHLHGGNKILRVSRTK